MKDFNGNEIKRFTGAKKPERTNHRVSTEEGARRNKESAERGAKMVALARHKRRHEGGERPSKESREKMVKEMGSQG